MVEIIILSLAILLLRMMITINICYRGYRIIHIPKKTHPHMAGGFFYVIFIACLFKIAVLIFHPFQKNNSPTEFPFILR